MITKRVLRWGVVLFLLAALPVMTVVMAQEEQPAADQLPEVTEPGESQAPEVWSVYESENNGSTNGANRMYLGDVMGGKIGVSGDVDYFMFNFDNKDWGDGYSPWPMPGNILIDIEAKSIGSSLNSVVCLYSWNGTELACNDDTDTMDSLVYYNLAPLTDDWKYYYISVKNKTTGGGNNYNYELILSSPLFISAAAANLGTGNVAGIPFQSGDILAWSKLRTGAEKWVLFFDASDVGITKNVTNIAAAGEGSNRFLLTLAANQTLPGAGIVKPWDFFVFNPTKYGPATAGTFQPLFIGSQHGLTTTAEKLDGISGWVHNWAYEGWCDGYLVSTAGTANVPGPGGAVIKPPDEDIFCQMYDRNAAVWGEWRKWFDASYALYIPAKWDITAFSVGMYPNYEVYLTPLGNTNICLGGYCVNYSQKNVYGFADQSLARSPDSPNDYGLQSRWIGSKHGWNYNIDAIEWSGAGWVDQQ